MNKDNSRILNWVTEHLGQLIVAVIAGAIIIFIFQPWQQSIHSEKEETQENTTDKGILIEEVISNNLKNIKESIVKDEVLPEVPIKETKKSKLYINIDESLVDIMETIENTSYSMRKKTAEDIYNGKWLPGDGWVVRVKGPPWKATHDESWFLLATDGDNKEITSSSTQLTLNTLSDASNLREGMILFIKGRIAQAETYTIRLDNVSYTIRE